MLDSAEPQLEGWKGQLVKKFSEAALIHVMVTCPQSSPTKLPKIIATLQSPFAFLMELLST
jgi:hypothetical protein